MKLYRHAILSAALLLASCSDSADGDSTADGDANTSLIDATPSVEPDAITPIDAAPEHDAAPARPQNIMSIGDSISEGSNSGNTYRSHLYFALTAAEFSFDFVGSNKGTCGNINAGTNDGWDADHNSFYSASAAQILDGNMPVNDCSPAGSGNIRDWAPAYEADIAIIHLGTNDCRGGSSPGQIQARLAGIITELRAAVPAVKVAVAQIISSRQGNINGCIATLNSQLPAWANKISTTASPVVVVDQHTGWDANAHQRDSFHPNALGAERMADKFLPVVSSFFE